MAIPVSIEKLLSGNIVEWARIEFKIGVCLWLKLLKFQGFVRG